MNKASEILRNNIDLILGFGVTAFIVTITFDREFIGDSVYYAVIIIIFQYSSLLARVLYVVSTVFIRKIQINYVQTATIVLSLFISPLIVVGLVFILFENEEAGESVLNIIGINGSNFEHISYLYIILAVILWIIVRFPSWINSIFSQKLKIDKTFDALPLALNGIPINRAASIVDFEARATELSRRSNIVLSIMIAVLISSAVFIVFAGVIARLGTYDIDAMAPIRDRVRSIEAELAEIDRNQETTAFNRAHFEALQSKLDSSSLTTEDRKYIYSFLDRAESFSKESDFVKNISVQHVSALVERHRLMDSNLADREKPLRDELNILYTQYRLAPELEKLRRRVSEETSDDVGSITSLLVAEGITRFGVLAIAIFLVQILINLYRYNTRLAAYYLAHKDSLLLEDHKPGEIAKLHKILWPDLQYGKQPTFLSNKLLETLNTAVSGLSSKMEKIGAPRKAGDPGGD